jgi:hypothetical protein
MTDKLAIRATISSQKMGDWFVNNGTREGINCWNNVVARTLECLKENQAALDIARADADTLRAEVADCHANINKKADFIDATINQLAAADELADTLRAEVARLKAAIEPFADVSDFLASETEGLSDDDVFNLKLAGARFLVMTYTAKQFHDARAALAHGEADQ